MAMFKISAAVSFIGIATAVFTKELPEGTATCQKFSVKYPTAESIAKVMWFDSFIYETDENVAYDMWPTDDHNDLLSVKFKNSGTISVANSTHFNAEGQIDKCYLDSYHKDADDPLDNMAHPLYKSEGYGVCTPWKDRGCCTPETQVSEEAIKTLYGAKSAWDICGPMSDACAKFYLEEDCFYECSPNAGLFKKYTTDGAASHNNTGGEFYDPLDDGHNKWAIYQMPIKASYFDAWHAACKDENIRIKWAGKPDDALDPRFLTTDDADRFLKQTDAERFATSTDHSLAVIGLVFGILGFLLGAYAVYLVRGRAGTVQYKTQADSDESQI